jgi:hypothetical protein
MNLFNSLLSKIGLCDESNFTKGTPEYTKPLPSLREGRLRVVISCAALAILTISAATISVRISNAKTKVDSLELTLLLLATYSAGALSIQVSQDIESLKLKYYQSDDNEEDLGAAPQDENN